MICSPVIFICVSIIAMLGIVPVAVTPPIPAAEVLISGVERESRDAIGCPARRDRLLVIGTPPAGLGAAG